MKDPDTDAEIEPDPETRAALRGLFHGAEPPPDLRARLHADAAARFGRPPVAHPTNRKRSWRLVPLGGALVAAAAALVLLVRSPGTAPGDTAGRDSAPQGSADVADVDESGTVDIFDAYLVARGVEAGATGGLPDIDGDGVVTRLDADLIASRAVEVVR